MDRVGPELLLETRGLGQLHGISPVTSIPPGRHSVHVQSSRENRSLGSIMMLSMLRCFSPFEVPRAVEIMLPVLSKAEAKALLADAG